MLSSVIMARSFRTRWPLLAPFALCLAGCGGTEFTAAATDSGAEGVSVKPEASVALDGAPADWCTTHMTSGMVFCEDFDHQPNINSALNAWTAYAQSGGLFALDTTAGLPSPPNALTVETTSGTNVKTLVEEVLSNLPSKPNKLRLEFDLRVDSPGTVGTLSTAPFAAIALGADLESTGVVALAIGNGPTLSAIYLVPDDGGSGFSAANASSFPEVGVWDGRFALEIDYTTSGGSGRNGCAQIYQAGQQLLSHCLALPSSLPDPTTVVIAIGAEAGGLGNTGMLKLSFDDVTFVVE
jgi:hypothetical protein